MARPTGIPGYLHHKASYMAYVRLNGIDIYLGFYGTIGSCRIIFNKMTTFSGFRSHKGYWNIDYPSRMETQTCQKRQNRR